MAPEKGRRCQVCGGVVLRVSKGGTVDYCNICNSCGRVAHNSCVAELKDVRVAGNFWLCQCGTRNQINRCGDWSTYD